MRGTRSLKVLQASALAMLIQTIILASIRYAFWTVKGDREVRTWVYLFFFLLALSMPGAHNMNTDATFHSGQWSSLSLVRPSHIRLPVSLSHDIKDSMFNVKEDGGNGWMQGIEERGEGSTIMAKVHVPFERWNQPWTGKGNPGIEPFSTFSACFRRIFAWLSRSEQVLF